MLFCKGLTCGHCWKSLEESEKSFLCGKLSWNISQLYSERCSNSLCGAKTLKSRAWAELCSSTEPGKVDFMTTKCKIHFLLLSPLCPPETCSCGEAPCWLGQRPGPAIVSCMNLCPPVPGHSKSRARLSQVFFLWLLSWHRPWRLFKSTMIASKGGRSGEELWPQVLPPLLLLSVQAVLCLVTPRLVEGLVDRREWVVPRDSGAHGIRRCLTHCA